MKFSAGKKERDPNIVLLKAGESITGILRGEPHEFKQAFKDSNEPKFRFWLNIITKVDGLLTCRIIEGGWKLYQQLRELSESGWDLEHSFIKITRTGAQKNDTVYNATVIPTKPTPEALEAASRVKLFDLPSMKGTAPEPAPEMQSSLAPQGYAEEDLPF